VLSAGCKVQSAVRGARCRVRCGVQGAECGAECRVQTAVPSAECRRRCRVQSAECGAECRVQSAVPGAGCRVRCRVQSAVPSAECRAGCSVPCRVLSAAGRCRVLLAAGRNRRVRCRTPYVKTPAARSRRLPAPIGKHPLRATGLADILRNLGTTSKHPFLLELRSKGVRKRARGARNLAGCRHSAASIAGNPRLSPAANDLPHEIAPLLRSRSWGDVGTRVE
jgi:hypothetical protein